jgi:hypothetical protein
MAWSGILIGLMPYALALIVAGVVIYNRRKHGTRAPGAGPS